MQTSRRNALKWIGGSVAAALTPLLSYSHSTTKPRSFTGEDMYRGIFFAEGEFAKLIPEITSLKAHTSARLTTNQSDHKTQVRQQIIQTIKQRDALFFDRFEAAMMSQNVLNVQRMLMLASANTSKAVASLYGSSGTATGQYRYETQSVSSKASSQTGMAIIVVNAIACVDVIYILVSATIFEQEQMASVPNASTLLIEQIALSVCLANRGAA